MIYSNCERNKTRYGGNKAMGIKPTKTEQNDKVIRQNFISAELMENYCKTRKTLLTMDQHTEDTPQFVNMRKEKKTSDYAILKLKP
ncbi:hypothetical protein H5410_014981 [Solanum commersonii]|uniref:Uncharacterized protein n=1 Tax=Solanum commersonii TaxID=4109 RepID=A0A9J5ZSB5_SOLCO|nr:hypothetical protein H5410_014981 [Solanum commersonii]